MKKFLSIVMILMMTFVLSVPAFAEGTTTAPKLTDEQKQAREAYLSVYLDKMNQIVDLRAQTKAEIDKIDALHAQIKEKTKPSTNSEITDAIAKIKAVVEQNKTLIAQAKDLDAQRKDLKTKYKAAVKAKDAKTMESLTPQILDISKKINDIRTQISTNMSSVKPERDKIEQYKQSKKANSDTAKPIIAQIKANGEKIKSEETAKNKLWETYKANITNHDYTAAGNTLQSIIDAKKQILLDLQARETLLNNLLSTLK